MIRMWNTDTASLVRTIICSKSLKSFVVLQSGLLAITSSYDGTIDIRDAINGSLIRTLAGHHAGYIQSLVVLRNGYLASGGRYPDQTIKIWNTDTGSLLTTLAGGDYSVNVLVQLHNGNLVNSYILKLKIFKLIYKLTGKIRLIQLFLLKPKSKR
jgi:WD40 repeat protein